MDGDLTRRKDFLDGLRGVAALMVLFAHLTISLLPAYLTFTLQEAHSRFDIAIGNSPLAIIWAGNFGVCLFFVLSGFVLSDFCRFSKICFPAKVVRRYFRLASPMLITSGFAWLLMRLGAYSNLEAAHQVTHSGWLTMWYQFKPNFFHMVGESLYGAFVTGHSDYNSNLWTMQIELVGSVYIFLLHTLFENKFVRILVSLVVYWVDRHSYYSLFMAGAIFFDLEGILRSVAAKGFPSNKWRECVMLLVFSGGVFCGAFPYVQPGMTAIWYSWLSHSTNAVLWHMLGAQLVIAALLLSTSLQGAFRCGVARYLGKISFVLYLIHLPIICSVTAWIALWMTGVFYPVTVVVSATVTVTVALAASTALHKYTDEYTTAASRHIGRLCDSWFATSAAPQRMPALDKPRALSGAQI